MCVCVCVRVVVKPNPVQLSSGEQVQSFVHGCVCVCVNHHYSRVAGPVLLIQKYWAGAKGGSWHYVWM